MAPPSITIKARGSTKDHPHTKRTKIFTIAVYIHKTFIQMKQEELTRTYNDDDFKLQTQTKMVYIKLFQRFKGIMS